MRWTVLSLVLFAACANPRAHIEKAVDAAGGLDAVAAVRTYHIESQGTWANEPFSTITHLRRPADWRMDMQADWGEMSSYVLGINHDVYLKQGEQKATVLTGAQRADTVQHMHVSNAVLLPDRLLEGGVGLQAADPVWIGDAFHPAVRVRWDDSAPVTFIFDPRTNRIAQVRFEMTDPMSGAKSPTTLTLSDYEKVGDVMVPHTMHVTGTQGGQPFEVREELTVVRWNPDPMPPGTLEVPETAPPPEFGVVQVEGGRIASHTFVGRYEESGTGIAKVMEWVQQNGGQPAGPVTLVYREPPNAEDYSKSKTVIQVPVVMNSVAKGEVRTMKLKPYQFAYATYEGPASGCWMLFQPVGDWCAQNGYQVTGPFRTQYITMDQETGMCKARVGCPVKEK